MRAISRQRFPCRTPLWSSIAVLTARTIDAVKRSPSPANASTLLLFDGDCGFCTSSIDWLAKTLPAFPTATPYQWVNLDEYGMTMAEAADRVWLITPTRHFGGHLAVSAVLRRQPSIRWRFLGWMLITPPFSWAAMIGYALVSRFRHRLPGGTPACQTGPAR